MRYLIGLMCVLAMGVTESAIGCGDGDCAGCWGFPNVSVRLVPPVSSTYDVDLVFDGASGAFTCEGSDLSRWKVTNRTGVAQAVVECSGWGFEINTPPESVEISVAAQDGSWTGSVKERPNYERMTVCGALCPPYAVVTVEQQ